MQPMNEALLFKYIACGDWYTRDELMRWIEDHGYVSELVDPVTGDWNWVVDDALMD